MPSFKQPTFQERAALAVKAKQAALQKLREKPPIDEAVVAARLAREEAQAKVREEKLAAREREKAEKAEKKARAAEAAASAKAPAPAMTEAEKKAARDARYAARKGRAGKR